VFGHQGQKDKVVLAMFISKEASFIAGGFYAPLADDLKKSSQRNRLFHDDLEVILNEKLQKNLGF
jgi:hypothetical protein